MRLLGVAVAVAVVITQTACSAPDPRSQSLSSTSETSKTVGSYHCSMGTMTPMTVLPPRGPGEPLVSVPTPPGWGLLPDEASGDLRGVIQSPALRSNDFTPSAVVNLADVSDDSPTAEQAIKAEQDTIAQLATVDAVADGTTCGSPSRTLTYRRDGRVGTELITAGKDGVGKVWVCTVAIETADPDSPQFVQDRDVILGNFQFIPRIGKV